MSGIMIILMFLMLIISAGIFRCYADDTVDGSVHESSGSVIGGVDNIVRGSSRGDFYLKEYGVNSEYPLRYESADESVLTVTDDGFVQMHSAGETVIKVTTEDPEEVKLINVTILKRERSSVMVRFCDNYEGDLSESKVMEIWANSSGRADNSAFTDFYLALDDSSIKATISSQNGYAQIDENGVVSFDASIHDDGTLIRPDVCFLIVTEETDLYEKTEFRFFIHLLRHEREFYFEETDISAYSTDGGYQLHLVCEPYWEIQYYSNHPDIATVDQSGYVTYLVPGEVTITALVDATEEYEIAFADAKISIKDNRQKQIIENTPDGGVYKFTYAPGESVNLGLTAKTPITYESNHPDIATVDNDGTMHFSRPGSILLTVEAAPTNMYTYAGRILVIVAEDPDVVAAREEEERRKAEEAAAEEARINAEVEEARRREAAEEARLKAEAEEARRKAASASNGKESTAVKQSPPDKAAVNKLAKALKRPKLKCTRKKGRNKLSWNKVKGASGYVLYVKYPGSRKYVKALKKSSKIKSVTHRGLTKGRVYKYKIRPYVKRGNIISYGKYSKAVKARVK